jgi:membrane glycosyltransferase
VLQAPTQELSETGAENPSGRRRLFATVVAATMAAMIWLMVVALGPGGFGLADLVLVVLFAITLPWTVIGFWNAVIGLAIMRFADDPAAAVTPIAGRVRGDEPITASIAIVLCIRNEVPERVLRNLKPMLEGLAASGFGDSFHLYVLSDTNDPAITAVEERTFGTLASQWQDRIAVTYRRRTDNAGFKAGNIRDFCERWGADHELAVTLDADSFMPADAVLRLVRIMQAKPRLGILQGLVVGLPSTSGFARLFQFGMRLSMRSYTLGSAWWQGDCGPYWGHNAALRLQPFIAHCHLPDIPETSKVRGHILSHDQIEAVLMRRAGYEVRVLPEDELGWEENPPTLVEFIRRDLRWCQGNMQYWAFLKMPGLKAVSRYQLALAILMFLGSPAWIGLLVVGALTVAFAATPTDVVRPDAGLAVFVLTVVMWFAPQLATFADILMSEKARQLYGGTPRFLAGMAIEIVFTILLCPIMWFGHTVFLVRLALGQGLGWSGQTRDDHRVPVALAARYFWPHTLLGLASVAVLAATHPIAIPYALYIAAGPLLAIPLAVLTSLPFVGLAFARAGIGRLPEETAPPPALHTLALPAVAAATSLPRPQPA